MNKIFNTKSECVYGILNAEKRNITEISRATGISRSQLTKWKSGKDIEVRIDSIYKLTNHLGLNVHFEPNQITINNTEDNNTNKEGNVNQQLLYEHIDLLKEKVKLLDSHLLDLKRQLREKEKNDRLNNPIWEKIDYDVMTTQVYENSEYRFFESYEIVRHHTFFAKLGYNDIEADLKYKELKNTVSAKSKNSSKTNLKWLFIKNNTDDNMLETKTKEFFLASKEKNMINALEMFKVTYKHKNGNSIPAIINVLYDFKGDSSISKIKFMID
jgi:transcriptional regulator with XRE-family HTH domain